MASFEGEEYSPSQPFSTPEASERVAAVAQ